MRDVAREFVGRCGEYLLFLTVVTPLLTLLVSLLSAHSFGELFFRIGMLMGMLLALSGAFSVMGLSNVFFERHGRLGLTDDERHDVSLHAAARLVCGIGAFFLFLLLS